METTYLQLWNVRCKVPKFVSKFVPMIHNNDLIVSNFIGWLLTNQLQLTRLDHCKSSERTLKQI
jgi:hypothetical protein